MPEYLAPDVYVEEIDTGSKPIEGVSTSTAGMVGVSERGPVNVPILITSYGEFRRWFGDALDPAVFVNGNELHCFLPHAADGFFTNGGKRVYITRVQSRSSRRAAFGLRDRGTAASAATWLLRGAPEGSGTNLADAIYVVNTNSVAPGTGALADGDHIRIGGGSDAEYWDVSPAATPGVNLPNHVTLAFPLARAHDPALPGILLEITRVLGAAPNTFALAADAAAGATIVSVTAVAGDVAVDDLIEIGSVANPIQELAEHRFVRGVAVDGPRLRLTLDSPLHRSHLVSPAPYISKLNSLAARVVAPAPNSFDLQAVNPGGISVTGVAGDIAQGDTLEIGAGVNARYRSVTAVVPAGPLLNVTLDTPTPGVVAPQPVGFVTKIVASTLEANRPVGAGDRVAFLNAIGANFVDPTRLVVFDPRNPATREARRIGRLAVASLSTGATDNYPGGTLVERITIAADGAIAVNPKALTADSFANGNVLSLNNRVGIVAGSVLQIGGPVTFEYAAVAQVPDPDPSGGAPDAGLVVLGQPLRAAFASGANVTVLLAPTVDPTRPAGVTVLTTRRDATQVVLSDGGSPAAAPPDAYQSGEVVRLTVPGVGVMYHALAGNAVIANAAPVRLAHALMAPHASGSPVAERTELITVEALDTGGWGNRLRLSVADEDSGAVARTSISTAIAPNRLRVMSATGIEPGTILEVRNGATGALLATVKAARIDRATAEVTLDAGAQLTAAQVASVNAAPANTPFFVRSREFSLTARLLAAPDPNDPARADVELDREVFRYLSMDPRHSRYIERVIGEIGGPPRLSDHRSDGESWYIRVQDLNPGTAVRFGPEALTDLLANGTREAARHALTGGNDGMATMDDATYVGADDTNPENRTGLFSLRNIEDLSIVAIPGRTSVAIQNALINHCELARYRFAVLDAQRPPRDAIADVINQRQQYDTKYAALYHPWLLIPPPFPTSPGQPDEYAIPPSGHMLGVYARTDIDRGVHKAPANEVVRGVVGLQRLLNKGEHDILNPYPVNINVIRDFRSNSRGIRVYGGRVITSDSDWKYVNVRRLMIFIEASINRGLQWVVFEPNAEPLWARVRRSISNFLTLVWRNGALEGTKVEEAYFVKCDRTTMTQTDIDSGRLICIVGVAPVKPAEFVIVRIGLWTAHADE